jgi:hypothetical protein
MNCEHISDERRLAFDAELAERRVLLDDFLANPAEHIVRAKGRDDPLRIDGGEGTSYVLVDARIYGAQVDEHLFALRKAGMMSPEIAAMYDASGKRGKVKNRE